MRAIIATIVSGLALSGCVTSMSTSDTALQGLVTVRSAHDANETTRRLQAALDRAGMRQFGVVDHAKGAATVGLDLPPTRVVIFGNPKAGTPLMRCAATAAIDLPMKALIYEDADGTTWYAYNDPQYLKARHRLPERCDPVLVKISAALGKFAAAATGN